MKHWIVKVFTVVLLSYIGIQDCLSQEVELLCKGTSSGSDVRTEKQEFPMTVNFVKPNIYGLPAYLIPSCVEWGEKMTNVTPNCTVNNNELNCMCSNSSSSIFSGISSFKLSRVNGRLTINTYFKNKENWSGDYICEKITLRKF